MDVELRAQATHILGRLPCALEMPAGTGKTQLVAGVAALAAEEGKRTLILTHTNAGVNALRKRLGKFGVPSSSFYVDTISGWAFKLVYHYPILAGLVVSTSPDWTFTEDYITAAIAVSRSPAMARVHAASFEYLLVDEYQDCSVGHHEFLMTIADAVNGTAVFGDRLQGIFDFKGQKLVDWETDVFPRFPHLTREYIPWRWRGHNDELGDWLLGVRTKLISGGVLDLSAAKVAGLTWKKLDFNAVVNAGFSHRNSAESVVVIDKWRPGNISFAHRLGGSYSVMEDLNGSAMRDALTELENLPEEERVLWLARQAKKCFSGFAKVDGTVTGRLGSQKPVDGLKRPGLEGVMRALGSVQMDHDYLTLSGAMNAIDISGEGKLYCHESWRDMAAAIRLTALENDRSLHESLSTIRDRLRYSGRSSHRRIASRTLLVKGLEYDHAIISNADNINDIKNLYVAMTRPRKSLTIFSASPKISLL